MRSVSLVPLPAGREPTLLEEKQFPPSESNGKLRESIRLNLQIRLGTSSRNLVRGNMVSKDEQPELVTNTDPAVPSVRQK